MNRERTQRRSPGGVREQRHTRLRFALLAPVLLLGLAALALPALARPTAVDRLDPQDGARLAEALRLKRDLGESVWPGWGRADIPFVLSNGRYAFLAGSSEPPAGWPAVKGATLDGQPYYRQRATASSDPALRLGDGWAAFLVSTSRLRSIRDRLPPFLARLFPASQPPASVEIGVVGALHASFHAYQAQVVPRHYMAARLATASAAGYGSAAPAMEAAWQREMSLLARALQSDSPEESATLAREFLAARAERRQAAGLDAVQVEYERQMEWLDGLTKYVEVNAWRHAYIASDYQPLPALANSPDFAAYQGFDEYWAAQLAALEQPAGVDSPTRLAASGMAQAILLDILGADWKGQAFENSSGGALEDLLAATVAGR